MAEDFGPTWEAYDRVRDQRAKAEAERDELRHENHHLHARVLSRDALLRQVSETQLAQDVTDAEAEVARLREGLDETARELTDAANYYEGKRRTATADRMWGFSRRLRALLSDEPEGGDDEG